MEDNMQNSIISTLEKAGIDTGMAPAPTSTTTPVSEQISQEPAPSVPANPTTDPQSTPNTPQANTPAFNFDDEIQKATNGSIKNSKELSDLISKSTQFGDFESRLKQFETENNDLKAKVSQDPFANDFMRRLNDLVKGGANDQQLQAFIALNKIDNLDGLSPLDAKLLALQVRNGLSAEDARIYLNSTYKIDSTEHDEDTVRREEIRLKVDAQADKDYLKQHKAEVSKMPENKAEVEQREMQQRQAQAMDKLNPMVKSAVANVSFKGFSLNGKEGDQAILHDFKPSEESMKNLEAQVSQFVQNNWNGIPTNEEGMNAIKGYAENILVLQNYKNWIKDAASVREKQVRAEYHNPTPINRGPDNPDAQKTSKEKMSDFLLRYAAG